MSSEPYADVREMYMAHTMFRREFGLLPALVGDVRAGDTARARVIADHFELIHTILYHHHHAEDTYLWPRVLSRAPESAAPVVALMGAQHGELDKVIDDLTAGLRDWRKAPARRRARPSPRPPPAWSACSPSTWPPKRGRPCR
jgi:hemerythrin-like domain-containing protein